MKSVMITHADEPIGRRIVKTLFHEHEVETIFAVGAGQPPRTFDTFLASSEPRVYYARVDLAKHRPMSDLFRSSTFRSARIDTVIHLPRHGAPAGESAPIVSGLPERTAEARLVLQHCLEDTSIDKLIALGSAFVYQLPPGNANRLDEESPLDLDPNVPAEIRSWIDCDMIFHGEVHNEHLRVVLLRVPTVVASGGFVYLSPALAGGPGKRFRVLGYDPICALVSDKDVARAVQAAIQVEHGGIYNIAGNEAVPLSMLARWTGQPSIPLPGSVLRWLATGSRLTGGYAERSALAGPQLRYGFTLDTTRAQHELGFRATNRIGLARAGDGTLRVETAAV